MRNRPDIYNAHNTFPIVETQRADGVIEIPAAVQLGGPKKVASLGPEEWKFVSGVTVARDMAENAIFIDTNDYMPDTPPLKRAEFHERPAVMRVLRGMGAQALDGFVVDFRYIRRYQQFPRGLEHGVDSEEFQTNVQQHGTTLPLGVIYNIIGSPQYWGKPDAADEAAYLAHRVDEYIQTLPADARPALDDPFPKR